MKQSSKPVSDPEAVNAVLLHYAGYIRYFSKVNGQVNARWRTM